MKIEDGKRNQMQVAAWLSESRATLRFRHLWLPILAILTCFLSLTAIFFPTVASALHLWRTSSAYTYGYLIIPISLFLIWQERDALAAIPVRPTIWGVALCALFAAAWFAADLLGIDEGRHLAFVGMLQGVFLAALGFPIYRRLAFALNYLWLMVPAGEFLLAPLQAIAHGGAVLLLRASGIPVFAEGMMIQVPQGTFDVEPGCAGLNFLLSALALSLVYGKLIYRAMAARLSCIAVALVVSVLANVVRIYLIIALTEWTQRKIGLADDHLLFGWGFFAVIMLALMVLGTRFGRPPGPPARSPARFDTEPPAWRAAVLAACAVVVCAVAPAAAEVSIPERTAVLVALPEHIGEWTVTESPSNWKPALAPSDGVLQTAYINAQGRRVDVAAALYGAQYQGHEAASMENAPAAPGQWSESTEHARTLVRTTGTVHAADVLLRAGGGRTRRVLRWYDSAGCFTASRLLSKVCSAKARLLGRNTAGAAVFVSAEEGDDPAAAQQDMDEIAGALPAFSALAKE